MILDGKIKFTRLAPPADDLIVLGSRPHRRLRMRHVGDGEEDCTQLMFNEFQFFFDFGYFFSSVSPIFDHYQFLVRICLLGDLLGVLVLYLL